MVSINLPIADQVVGSCATSTTHLLVLERLRAFFNSLFGKPIEIDNPYIWKTKAEVIRTIAERRLRKADQRHSQLHTNTCRDQTAHALWPLLPMH